MRELSEVDREIIRASLVEIAETVRKKYGLTVNEARRQLHQMLDVTV
jgi:transcription termination factor NusB